MATFAGEYFATKKADPKYFVSKIKSAIHQETFRQHKLFVEFEKFKPKIMILLKRPQKTLKSEYFRMFCP